jgi:hypothetical protein
MAFSQLPPEHEAFPAALREVQSVHVFAQRLQWRDGEWDVSFSPRSEYHEAIDWCHAQVEPYSWYEIGDSLIIIHGGSRCSGVQDEVVRMRLEEFAPNPRTANGFWATTYLYVVMFGMLAYAWTIRYPTTIREHRQWKLDKEINARWGRAVYAEQRKVEEEIEARDGRPGIKTQADADRYNNAGKHLRREDFA